MFSSALNAVIKLLVRQGNSGLIQAAKGPAFARAPLNAPCCSITMDSALLSKGTGYLVWRLLRKPGCQISDANSTWALRGVSPSGATPMKNGGRPIGAVRSFQTALPSQQVASPVKKGATVQKRAGPNVAVTMEEALALQGISLFRTPKPKDGVTKKDQGARQTKERGGDSNGEGKGKAVVSVPPKATEALSIGQKQGALNGVVGSLAADVSKGVRDGVGKPERSNGAVRGASESSQGSGVALEESSLQRESSKRGAKPVAKKKARNGAAVGPVEPAHAVVKPGEPIKEVPAAGGAQNELTLGSSIDDALEWCCKALGRAPGEAEQQLSERLQENWYSKASDLVGMADQEARTLAVPVRFLLKLREGLAQSASEDGQTLNGVQNEKTNEKERATSGESASTSAPSTGAVSTLETDLGSSKVVAEPAGLSDSIAAVAPAVDNDIMSRRMPPMGRHGHSNSYDVRVTKRKVEGLTSYRLKPGEGSPELTKELDAFLYHCTNRFYGQQMAPIADVTARKYLDHIRGALGWLHYERGIPLTDLRLPSLVPSHERAGVQVGFDYVMWLLRERGITRQTEGLVARSLMRLAMFLFHAESKAQPSEGEKAYGDLMVVREYRKLANESRREAKIAPRSSDETLKWLSWPEYLAVVQELKLECAGRDPNGRLRPPSAVAWSLQRYLIFAILSCIPDRQRTLRELQVGRTLFKEGDRWVIRHGPDDYKTGRAYGVRPALAVSSELYPELEAFMDTWRAHLNPQHEFLFSTKNGKPLKETDVYKLFYTTAYRITGKKTNPHLVRDSVVTHLRGTGASERELEALAIYMGHSVEMQRSTYDRRTMAEKVGPAIELLNNLNQEALGKRLQRSEQ